MEEAAEPALVDIASDSSLEPVTLPPSPTLSKRSPSPEPPLPLIVFNTYIRKGKTDWAPGLIHDSIDMNGSFEEVKEQLVEFAKDKFKRLKSRVAPQFNITFST